MCVQTQISMRARTLPSVCDWMWSIRNGGPLTRTPGPRYNKHPPTAQSHAENKENMSLMQDI